MRFSAMQPPALERRWTAVLSVDASRCTTTSGSFGLVFSRLKENGPTSEFEEQFVWTLPSVMVSVDFAPTKPWGVFGSATLRRARAVIETSGGTSSLEAPSQHVSGAAGWTATRADARSPRSPTTRSVT